MVPVLLSLAAKLWGCTPEFEPIGEPKSNLFPGSGGTDKKDVGDGDSYIVVVRDSGNPPPAPRRPPPPSPPPPPPARDAGNNDRETGPIPALNEPPQFGGLISPSWDPIVVPNAANQYEFIFQCYDPENNLEGGSILVEKVDNDRQQEGDDILVNPYDPPRGTVSTAAGGLVTVRVPAQNLPPLSLICWAPYTCTDGFGNETFMEIATRPAAELQAGRDYTCFETTERGVVHHWSFDYVETNQNQVIDQSETGDMPGTMGGRLVLDEEGGIKSQAIHCDGVNDYVETPQARLVGIANTWTVSWWQYLNRDDNEDLRPEDDAHVIATIGNRNGDSPPNWLQFLTTRNRSLMIEYTSSSGGFKDFRTQDGVLDTRWQYIAMVHTNLVADGPPPFRLYLNGEVTPFTQVGADFYRGVQTDTPRYISLCRQLRENSRYMQGGIDEFVIYNRALSWQEIQAACERNAPVGHSCRR